MSMKPRVNYMGRPAVHDNLSNETGAAVWESLHSQPSHSPGCLAGPLQVVQRTAESRANSRMYELERTVHARLGQEQTCWQRRRDPRCKHFEGCFPKKGKCSAAAIK